MLEMNCRNDANPDAWFPESPQGNQSQTKMKALAQETLRAINLCNSCPSKASCLEDGMKPSNLPYGIWGGMLAGERLILADAEGLDYMVKPDDRKGRLQRIPTDSSDSTKYIALKERDVVTQDEKRIAVNFYTRITPYLEELNV